MSVTTIGSFLLLGLLVTATFTTAKPSTAYTASKEVPNNHPVNLFSRGGQLSEGNSDQRSREKEQNHSDIGEGKGSEIGKHEELGGIMMQSEVSSGRKSKKQAKPMFHILKGYKQRYEDGKISPPSSNSAANSRFAPPERRMFPEVDWRGFNEDVFHESFGNFAPMKKWDKV